MRFYVKCLWTPLTFCILIEVYDRDQNSKAQLANISARGLVESGDNVLIGGFIVSDKPAGTRILARGIGPSLKPGVPNAIGNPTIELVDHNGTRLDSNDNWEKSPDRAEIESTQAEPKNDAEAAIISDVLPGAYTVIVRNKSGKSGVGLVDIYNVPRQNNGD